MEVRRSASGSRTLSISAPSLIRDAVSGLRIAAETDLFADLRMEGTASVAIATVEDAGFVESGVVESRSSDERPR